jgi:hypothetical protein
MSLPENPKPEAQTAQAEVHPALANTIRLLARLGREKFFGKLTIELKDGVIVVIRREETIKP